MPKDFKDSWEQRSWESALARYTNLGKMLKLSRELNHERGVEYAETTRAGLLERYPQLSELDREKP